MSDETFNLSLWLKQPENRYKFIMLLVALNLLVGSVLLFMTASGQGAIYELIKPSDVTLNFKLVDRYIESNTEGGYEDTLVLEVILLDEYLKECGEIEKIYLENKQFAYDDLIVGEVICVRYVDQLLEDKYIESVMPYIIIERNTMFKFNR